MLSEQQRSALLMEIHKSIEEAITVAANPANAKINYPPNGGLLEEERVALTQIALNPTLVRALRKVMADVAAYPIFHFLTLLDGVSDPDNYASIWTGCNLEPKNEDTPNADYFLHDEMYATYWDWRNSQGNLGSKLDNVNE